MSLAILEIPLLPHRWFGVLSVLVKGNSMEGIFNIVTNLGINGGVGIRVATYNVQAQFTHHGLSNWHAKGAYSIPGATHFDLDMWPREIRLCQPFLKLLPSHRHCAQTGYVDVFQVLILPFPRPEDGQEVAQAKGCQKDDIVDQG